MGQTLNEIAQVLKDSTHRRKPVAERILDVKAHLIYAFNGTGKTRLSQEFKDLINSKLGSENDELSAHKIIYYNAFTEDLFYWVMIALRPNLLPKVIGSFYGFWKKRGKIQT